MQVMISNCEKRPHGQSVRRSVDPFVLPLVMLLLYSLLKTPCDRVTYLVVSFLSHQPTEKRQSQLKNFEEFLAKGVLRHTFNANMTPLRYQLQYRS